MRAAESKLDQPVTLLICVRNGQPAGSFDPPERAIGRFAAADHHPGSQDCRAADTGAAMDGNRLSRVDALQQRADEPFEFCR
jgi:hypothetical protein